MNNTHPNTLPVRWPETAYQGDDWLRQYRFFFETEAGDIDILNTNGWTGGMAVKADIDDVTPLLTSPGTISVTAGVTGTTAASTTLASGAAGGASTVTATSATGMAIGQALAVTLDDLSVHASFITNIAGSVITIASPLPSAATSGNAVTAYADPYCLEIAIAGSAITTGGIVGWYDIELTDTSGRDQTYLFGPFPIRKEVFA